MSRWTIPLILPLLCSGALAQGGFTLSGNIKDKATGEDLIGALVQVTGPTTTGVSANTYGFYSLTLPPGDYTVRYSFMGYTRIEQPLKLDRDIRQDIQLAEATNELKAVEVTSRGKDKNIADVQMSSNHMSIETMKTIPAFMGEVDVIKALQMLPGVQTMGEGGSGMYVRGGGVDQNLILLDEAPVYNAAHLLGFFSVFNGDAIKDVQLYKGGIPASYGGRLSSVVDIRMKDGNNQKFNVEGGLGTIASRLTVQAPIVKDKGSFIVSGRRTYADQFLGLSNDKGLKHSKLYFYDMNMKANYTLNENNRVFASGYFGRDVFKNQGIGLDWGNATGTVRWNHVFNAKLFANITGIYSTFNYGAGSDDRADAFEWTSSIRDVSGKADFNYYFNPNNTIKFGGQISVHTFAPGKVTGESDESAVTGLELPRTHSVEEAFYISNEQRFGSRFTATYGVRISAFENLGTRGVFEEDPEQPDANPRYVNWEPRLGAKYALTEMSSIKASYNRTAQYLHLASNGNSSTPFDIWFPTSERVKPEVADQYALGYFRNFSNNRYEFSVEGYYKEMRNAVDFKDNANLFLNESLEDEVRFGTAWAYGSEFMVRKQEGKLTGMLSYTLSHSDRRIDGINDGKKYRSKYDKTHNVSLMASYKLTKLWSVGASWVYQTGSPITMPIGRYEYGGQIVPIYSERNAERMPDYHRMDLSVTKASRKNETRRWQSEWVFSVYNAYARKNTYSINFRQDKDEPNKTFAEKTYLFSIVPSITYNFKF